MLSTFTPTPHPELYQLYLVQYELKGAVVSFYSFLLNFPSGLEIRIDKGNLFGFIDGRNSDEIS
jgi:hypothetical protein